MPTNALVVGCGFVGFQLLQRFVEAGWETAGLTLNQESAFSLQQAGWPVFCLDVTDERQLADLRLNPGTVVVYCASSGRSGAAVYRTVFITAVDGLLRRAEVAHLVLASSTSVYHQTSGEVVDERSPTNPDRETGQILLQAERQVLAAQGTVARLAGIYGPGRCVPLQKLLSGEAVIEETGSRIMNSIHRDDAAAALFLLACKRPSGIFNVSDDSPVTQLEWYAGICRVLQLPPPLSARPDSNRKRGWTSKRVSNSKLRALGWEPAFPSFRDGVLAMLRDRETKSEERGGRT